MVATLLVYHDFGGTDASPGTNQNTTSLGPPTIQFKTADSATVDSNFPIPVVSGQTKYSYWKHIYLYCSVAPSSQVDNIKFYTDGGGFGTGITLNVGDEQPMKNSSASSGYEVATGTAGNTGDEVTANHSEISSVTDAFTYTSTNPLTVTVSETDNLIDAVGETTNYLVFQMAVADTASTGTLSNETITFQYDEI